MLVELVAVDAGPDRAARAIQFFGEHAAGVRDRMEHQVAAQRAAGSAADVRCQQQTRRTDPVARDHRERRRLLMRRAIPVAVRQTDRAPALHDYVLRDAMRPQRHAVP